MILQVFGQGRRQLIKFSVSPPLYRDKKFFRLREYLFYARPLLGVKDLKPQSGCLSTGSSPSVANSLTTDSSFSVGNSLSAANRFLRIGVLCCGAFCCGIFFLQLRFNRAQ